MEAEGFITLEEADRSRLRSGMDVDFRERLYTWGCKGDGAKPPPSQGF